MALRCVFLIRPTGVLPHSSCKGYDDRCHSIVWGQVHHIGHTATHPGRCVEDPLYDKSYRVYKSKGLI